MNLAGAAAAARPVWGSSALASSRPQRSLVSSNPRALSTRGNPAKCFHPLPGLWPFRAAQRPASALSEADKAHGDDGSAGDPSCDLYLELSEGETCLPMVRFHDPWSACLSNEILDGESTMVYQNGPAGPTLSSAFPLHHLPRTTSTIQPIRDEVLHGSFLCLQLPRKTS